MSAKPDAELVIKALDRAYEIRDRPCGILFHSDQDSQYGGRSFRQRLWRYRMTQSMSRQGSCYDNAAMERLFRSLKTEWVPTVGYMTTALAEWGIGRYLMQRYNWARPHQHTVSYRRLLRKKNPILCPGIVDHYNSIMLP